MPKLFPCPNNQCTYQFDAELLPAAAMVTCPLCRTKFPYRAPKPEGEEPKDGAPTGPRVVSLRTGPNRGSVWTTVGWVGGFTIVLVGLLAAFVMWNNKKPGKSGSGTVFTEDALNFTLEEMGSDWTEDMDVRKALDVNVFARKRKSRDAWAALYAKDYGTTNPRRGELRDKLLSALKTQFSNINTVELEGAKWAGQPAMAYQFDGDANDVHMVGECHAIGYKGIAYAYFIFAPAKEWDNAKSELAALRDKFKLATYREKWTEEVSNVASYPGNGYEVSDIDGKWVKAKVLQEGEKSTKKDYLADPKEIDPSATMAFLISYVPRTAKDRRVNPIDAKAVVVELGGGDPLETAKNHVVERIKKRRGEDPGAVKLEPYGKSPSGIDLPKDGPAMGRFLFQDPDSPASRELWMISAISVGGKVIAVEIETPLITAQYVEEWMIHLAHSLKAK
jgi:hypothetical protein